MASLAQFRVYAPELEGVPDDLVNKRLLRANGEVERRISSATIAAQDRIDAECALAVHFLLEGKALAATNRVGTRKVGAASVTTTAEDLAAMLGSSASMDERCWQHLRDGGLPWTARGVGVAR